MSFAEILPLAFVMIAGPQIISRRRPGSRFSHWTGAQPAARSGCDSSQSF
jgi:hypothetical protein